jgi:RND family efflux transporter MFP subunit
VAPVDGVVTAVAIEPGFLAPASDDITLDGATLEVVADVVESDVASLQTGQSATISIDALGLDVPGTVTSIAPSTDAGTSSVVTYPVTVTLDDPDPSVRSGMSADVEIVVAQASDVVAVPLAALAGSAGTYTVTVVDPSGGTQTRAVEVGLVTETLAEITSGVSAGESVVVGTDSQRTTTSDQGDSFGPGGFAGPGALGGLGSGSFRDRRGGGD